LKEHNLKVILIQLDEAHSDAWPVALKDQPSPQKDFQTRVSRANYFVDKYSIPYTTYIDKWDNEFAELFRAWPDKYYCIDKNLQVVAKSEYGREGENEARVILDYTVLLERLMSRDH
jgi:superfamily I DNA and/or RNA helicase